MALETMTTPEKLITDMAIKIARTKETLILESLNELISRGLLVVEETQPVLVRECDSASISVRQSVRIHLKDQEYIQKLEKENQDLKSIMANLELAISKFMV